MRVPSTRLDRLVNLVGELVMNQSRLSQVASRIAHPDLNLPVEVLERLIAELRDAVLGIRMMPIGTTFGRFKRLVHDLSAELRKGPRGGGRDRDEIVHHVNGAEIFEYAKKVGVRTPLEAYRDPAAVREHRLAMVEGIRATNARGAEAGRWTVSFLIRRVAWHMLDHAWEMEDRDLAP